MRDPRITALHFKVTSAGYISYRNPAPTSFTNDLGIFEISSDTLKVTPAEPFTSEDQAREAIEPYLRAWEIQADISINRGAIFFQFDRCEIVDLNPQTDPQRIIHGQLSGVIHVNVSMSAQIVCEKYPSPPISFEATLQVQQMHRRWKNYHEGKEPLPAMAYFVLTSLQGKTPKNTRGEAAKQFKIDRKILDRVGELSSEKGDALIARKYGDNGIFKELTELEKSWLEQAVRLMITRVGEYPSIDMLKELTLNDLPSL